jgi:hypothetical protein
MDRTTRDLDYFAAPGEEAAVADHAMLSSALLRLRRGMGTSYLPAVNGG